MLSQNSSLASENSALHSTNLTPVRVHLFLTRYIIELHIVCLVVAGGFFTDRYLSPDSQVEKGSRFDPERIQGKVSVWSTSEKYIDDVVVQ